MPVTQITSKIILEVARRIAGRGLGETARRVVQIIGQVMLTDAVYSRYWPV
jgi:hypothetical protein